MKSRLFVPGARWLWGLGALIVLLLAWLTWRQIGPWENDEVLWEKALVQGDYPGLALKRLGDLSLRRGSRAETIAFYQRSLEIDPDDMSVVMNLGTAQLEQGDVEAAIRTYQNALVMNGYLPELHFNLALALRRAGRSESALRHCEEAHRLDPEDNVTLFNLAVLLLENGSPEQSTGPLEILRTRDATNSDAAHYLGVARLRLGQTVAAQEALESAHALAPWDLRNARLLGGLLLRRGSYARAVEVLEEALSHEAKDPQLNRELAWIRATSPQVDQRDPAGAVVLSELAWENSEGEPSYLDAMAAAYAADGRFVDAEKVAQVALGLTPPGSELAEERERRRALYARGELFAPR